MKEFFFSKTKFEPKSTKMYYISNTCNWVFPYQFYNFYMDQQSKMTTSHNIEKNDFEIYLYSSDESQPRKS